MSVGMTVSHPRYGFGDVVECPAQKVGRFSPQTWKVRFDQDARYNCARTVFARDCKPAQRPAGVQAARPEPAPVVA